MSCFCRGEDCAVDSPYGGEGGAQPFRGIINAPGAVGYDRALGGAAMGGGLAYPSVEAPLAASSEGWVRRYLATRRVTMTPGKPKPPPLPRPPPPPRSALVGTPITASRSSFRLTPSYLTWLHPRTGFPCAHNRKGGGVDDGRKHECKLGACGTAQW